MQTGAGPIEASLAVSMCAGVSLGNLVCNGLCI